MSKFKFITMDFKDLIQKRRSIRKFTDEQISQDDVVELMKAALLSPSSMGKQAWEFVVIEDKDTLAKLSQCKDHGADLLKGAALAVVVLGDSSVSDVWIEDASIAALMIQLQAENLGLGSCWVQVRNRYKDNEISANNNVQELLNIPEHMQCVCIIGIGHKGQKVNPKEEGSLPWEKLHIGTYKSEE